MVFRRVNRRKMDRQEKRRRLETFDTLRGFDVFGIRWLFEGRLGRDVHPEDDWDHPAWSYPNPEFAAYDAGY